MENGMISALGAQPGRTRYSKRDKLAVGAISATGTLSIVGGINLKNPSFGAIYTIQPNSEGPVFDGKIYLSSTQNSTSLNTGALWTSGGIAVTKDIYCGGNISATGGFNFGTYNTIGYYGMKYDPTSGGAGILSLSRSAGAGDIMITLDPASNVISAGTGRFNTLQNSSVTTSISLNDSANTVSQRNGVNPQTFNIYNTYTSATIAERASLKWVANTFVIGTETLPTSASNRDMSFQTASSTQMTITSGGLVGIGTTNPSEKLTVVGNISTTGVENSSLNSMALLASIY